MSQAIHAAHQSLAGPVLVRAMYLEKRLRPT